MNSLHFIDFPQIPPSSYTSSYPYILCNEEGMGATLEVLEAAPRVENALHLGFSCWYNYDVIAIRRPLIAVICDINTCSLAALEHLKATLLASGSRQEFHLAFGAFVTSQENPETAVYPGELERPHSWLSSDAGFETVKQMYREGRISHQPLNMEDQASFIKIRNWADSKGFVFDTVYSSNIREWTRSKAELVEGNLRGLVSVNTWYIEAKRRFVHNGGPIQRISQGLVPEFSYEIKRKFRG